MKVTLIKGMLMECVEGRVQAGGKRTGWREGYRLEGRGQAGVQADMSCHAMSCDDMTCHDMT